MGVPSFARDVLPLFREMDRSVMDYRFDLSSARDVRTHADLILGRLEDGSMPCDGPWPEERVALFRAWVAGGCPD